MGHKGESKKQGPDFKNYNMHVSAPAYSRPMHGACKVRSQTGCREGTYLMLPSTFTLLVMTYWLPEVTPRVLAGMLLLAELRVRRYGPLPK